jgi:hypothetical protein
MERLRAFGGETSWGCKLSVRPGRRPWPLSRKTQLFWDSEEGAKVDAWHRVNTVGAMKIIRRASTLLTLPRAPKARIFSYLYGFPFWHFKSTC